MAFQSTVTVGLVMATLIVGQQLHLLLQPDRGFDSERLVALELAIDLSEERKQDVASMAAAFPDAVQVTVSGSIPGAFNARMASYQKDSTTGSVPRPEEIVSLYLSEVDAEYIPALGLTITAGRNFQQRDHTSETFIINQTTARTLGWRNEEAIGKPFNLEAFGNKGVIIGVAEDFHMTSLKSKIKTVVLLQESESFSSSPHVTMRLAETAGTAFVDNLLQALPQRGEIEVKGVSCVDETFDAMYRSETRAGAAIFVFALTTIFISCLGLYGFMLAIIRQRKREFAIRCALGATVRHVLSLMGSEIAVFVAISAVIGCSVARYAGHVWLQEFPYRIDLSAEVPIFTVAIVALLIGLTVFSSCYQTLAERPADALRQA